MTDDVFFSTGRDLLGPGSWRKVRKALRSMTIFFDLFPASFPQKFDLFPAEVECRIDFIFDLGGVAFVCRDFENPKSKQLRNKVKRPRCRVHMMSRP